MLPFLVSFDYTDNAILTREQARVRKIASFR